ncbi:hypothetical protein [Rhodopseudomonas palustris]|nr:hypothetical protein [Rhodopseudomonas palustris]
MLGEAIRNQWPAHAIEAAARQYKGRGDLKYRLAIQDASKRRYYSPEERAADYAALHERQAELEARSAMKATKATRPSVPPEFKAARAACRSVLDCDRLKAALEAGWLPEQLNYVARQLSKKASRVAFRETPAAYRHAFEFINGADPAHFTFLPLSLQSAAHEPHANA